MRAKWRTLKSGRCSAPQKVLDRGDIVRDGLFSEVTCPGGGLGVSHSLLARIGVHVLRDRRRNLYLGLQRVRQLRWGVAR